MNLPRADRAESREAALDAFLRGVERRALRHVELAGCSREDALDILQEAMLAFVRRYRAKPAEEWPLLFWRVLESKQIDAGRRRSVIGRWFGWLGLGEDLDGADPMARIADPAEPGPVQRLGDREATAALEKALRALPGRQRQAFLLRVWEGLDVADTARAMGVSEGSVKTHLFRALQTLRGRLEDHL
ncbi:RNA polymerase sigma factor [Pseudomarimonas salicorniae]|uniref:RNA polymerase sigma factor n=1 Tax=Pseudomarimonas salicorniae TaxID=2933270 RepID=A0ABT0GD67_9GAMM|nr:RNA polymerase sigma factor [Lysobacter sp. CAU 1642]MCK7592478.1 RNA polymerase sigma factor [Lysobacter sp. CAU 1642]